MKIANRASKMIGTGSIAMLLILIIGAARHQGRNARPANTQAHEQLIFSVKGPDLFRAYCASCHGSEGRGDGPMAPILKTQPSDLTTISRRNHGIFPAKTLEQAGRG